MTKKHGEFVLEIRTLSTLYLHVAIALNARAIFPVTLDLSKRGLGFCGLILLLVGQFLSMF